MALKALKAINLFVINNFLHVFCITVYQLLSLSLSCFLKPAFQSKFSKIKTFERFLASNALHTSRLISAGTFNQFFFLDHPITLIINKQLCIMCMYSLIWWRFYSWIHVWKLPSPWGNEETSNQNISTTMLHSWYEALLKRCFWGLCQKCLQ